MPILSPLKAPPKPSTAGNSIETPDVYYNLEVENIQLGTFFSLEGGSLEISVIKHYVTYESGETDVFFIPNGVACEPITLSKGFGNSQALYNWFAQVSAGQIFKARRNATITLNKFSNGKFEPIVRWNLSKCWPSKLSGFRMNQYTGAEIAKFEITIVAESIDREDV